MISIHTRSNFMPTNGTHFLNLDPSFNAMSVELVMVALRKLVGLVFLDEVFMADYTLVAQVLRLESLKF